MQDRGRGALARRTAIGAIVGLGALGSAAGIAAAGGEAERAGEPTGGPYTKRCVVAIRAHEDGSASLFCTKRERPFGAVDAESGRIRFYR